MLDRAYRYDHAGRLKEAYSGREARGLAPPSVPDNPLRQSYTYDAWDNMGRVGRTWTNGFADIPVYHNDRRDGWGYDADGRDVSGGTGNSVTTEAYDAAGRHVRRFEDTALGGATENPGIEVVTEQNTIEQTYGGDDLVGKRVETRHRDDWAPASTFVTTVYYLRSTALGGRVLAEVDGGGGKRKGEVYLGGERLAELEVGGGSGDVSVMWKHADPSRGSYAESYAGGLAVRKELDPLGQEVGTENPYALYGGSYGQMVGGNLLYGEGGNPFDVRHGCGTIDGMPASCSEVRGRMDSGSVAAEFLLHGADGFHRIQSPILSFGAGQFGVNVPYLKPNNEWEPDNPASNVAWQEFAFSFAPQEPKTISGKQLKAAINTCLQKLSPAFSVSSFVPTEKGKFGEITVTVGDWRFEDTSTIRVRNDATHSSAGVGLIRDRRRGWPLGTTNVREKVYGYTPIGEVDGYTAKDAVGTTGLAALVGPIIENQLHEFAHGLGNAVDPTKKKEGSYFNDRTHDGDAGRDFTDCVLNGLKGK